MRYDCAVHEAPDHRPLLDNVTWHGTLAAYSCEWLELKNASVVDNITGETSADAQRGGHADQQDEQTRENQAAAWPLALWRPHINRGGRHIAGGIAAGGWRLAVDGWRAVLRFGGRSVRVTATAAEGIRPDRRYRGRCIGGR